MKVIDGTDKFKQEEEETPSATEMFTAFADLCHELDKDEITTEAVVVLITDAGVTVGGSIIDPPILNYMLELGKQAIMNEAFMESDADGTIH